MNRIVIVGTTGSGKSTLAEVLARQLDLAFVDLDALHWEPNWKAAEPDIFRERVRTALRVDRWVVGGNYSKARDIIWTQADTLVWLDYPLWLSQWRLFKRTLKRVITREELWGTGNVETWRNAFRPNDNLFQWAVTSRRKHHAEYPVLFTQPEYRHLQVFRLHSPAETHRWCAEYGVTA
jgi:adenylate kinase family enzyme